jgi:hypothetical protein
MYFVSGSLVAAVNVLLVVALVVVALLVMPLIRDYAARLITRRLRGTARSAARSARANTPKADISPSKTEDETLKARRGASNQSRVSREALAVSAKCVLSCEDSDKLMSELDKRSSLIDAQKTAITALKIQVETLKARLKWATNDRDVQNLENRLAEQSRRLNESEFELKYLRSEVEIAQKAEAYLRRAVVEIDGLGKRATQNHEAEKAKLQAALDRANGERARLAYELAKIRQQAKRPAPVERVEDVMPRECIVDVECSESGERTFLNQPLIESDDMKGCLSGQRAATVLNRAAQADVVRAIALCRVVR